MIREGTLNSQASEHVQEIVIAAALISESAGKASKALDKFASWLLAGFGGAVALLLSGRDLRPLVPVGAVRIGSILFLCAVLVTVLQKYLAIVVTSGAEGAALGRALVKEHLKERKELGLQSALDPETLTKEMLKALYWPATKIASRFIARSKKGDFAAGARAFMKLAQVQGFFVMLELGLFFSAAICIIWSLP
jgi:hypothetical protein